MTKANFVCHVWQDIYGGSENKTFDRKNLRG